MAFTDVADKLLVDLTEAVAVTGHPGYVPGVTVGTYWPDKVNAPTILIGADEPFITGGQFFSEYEVHLNASILVIDDREQLNKLIATVLLATTDYALTSVSAPGRITWQMVDYIGAVVSLALATKL
jgi:hypothetical protein